jgi:drug/metabolite transporter (DMT)-like permease
MDTHALKTPATIKTGWLFALASTLIYSFQAILLKATLNLGISADDLLVLRLLMASLIFWFMAKVRKESVEKLPAKAFFWCFVCALTFVGGMYGYTLALTYTSTSIASMIFSVFPIATLIILSFLGEPFTARKAMRIILGLAGVYLIVGPGGDVNPLGILFALGACIIYSSFLVIMQRSLSQYKGSTVMLYVTSFTCLCFLLINIFDGIAFASITPLAWFFIFLQAALGTYIAQLLLFSAVKGIGSAQMSMLFPLELLLTIVWSVLILAERLSLIQSLGGAFIILSLLLALNNPGFIRRRLIRPRV